MDADGRCSEDRLCRRRQEAGASRSRPCPRPHAGRHQRRRAGQAGSAVVNDLINESATWLPPDPVRKAGFFEACRIVAYLQVQPQFARPPTPTFLFPTTRLAWS
ncbi:hypothetical protein ACRAWD_04090 [Caulobacter segnis]